MYYDYTQADIPTCKKITAIKKLLSTFGWDLGADETKCRHIPYTQRRVFRLFVASLCYTAECGF